MTPDRSAAAPGLIHGYLIVFALFLIVLVGWGTFFSFGVFLDPLAKTFSSGKAETAGAYSLATLIAGFMAIAMGRLNDLLGPRIVLSISGLIVGIGYLLAALATSLWQLYLFYGIVIGIGVAGLFVPTTSTIARWFVQKRTFMTGIVLMGISVGTMIVPRVAARLIAAWGWRTTFIIMGVLNLLTIISLAQLLKPGPENGSLAPNHGAGTEAKGANRQLSGHSLPEAVYMKQFWLLSGIYFCFYFCINSVVAHIVMHASTLGISLEKAANIMIALGGGGIIGRIVISVLGDRIGNRQTCLLCFVVMCLAIFSLRSAADLPSLSVVSAFIGLCFAGGGALMAPLIADYFGLKSHGLILGFVYASDMVGGAIGPVMAGAIFDITHSYNPAFLVSAIVAALGSVLIVLLR